jgi:DeoR family transcriptional regulator, fructose operon transcriptional repressor
MKKEQALVDERKQSILEYVNLRRKVSVAELCEKFGVSSATIRNDLRELDGNRLLVRTHGGAILLEKARFEPEAEEKEDKYAEEKRRIARAALGLIDDGDTIIVDTGTTTQKLADLLDGKPGLTVLTNDILIARRLEDHPSATVHLIGGVVRRKFHCTVGPKALEMLAGLTVDKAFMGANSFSLENGASTPDFQQSELKRLMARIATKVYLLVDGTKIGRNSFVRFASIEDIDCLITDSIGDDERRALEESGVEVIVADKNDA